jgi:protein-S-isoprenylcysteine O-methyltransferase Ste14
LSPTCWHLPARMLLSSQPFTLTRARPLRLQMSQAFAADIVGGLWVVFGLYWLLTARNVKATRWQEPARSQALYRIPMLAAALLLTGRFSWPHFLNDRFLPRDSAVEVAGVLTVALGVAFAIWARRHIGTNWSATITVKADHTLVRSGPYAIVRHPIYTGMLLGLLGTAVTIGQWRGIVAVALVVVAFLYKSRVEERQMRAIFPEYEEYQRHTAALIPLLY